MLDFDELSRAGRVKRLRLLAIGTLADEFGIDTTRVSLLANHSFNTLFRADPTGGEPLAVRVGEVRIHADRVEEVEARWLAALRADTDLLVPTLLPTTEGNHVVAGTHPQVPGRRYCSVMTWVRGHTVREEFDHTLAERLGALQATLHEHAAGYTPPEIPRGIIANQVVYFGNTSLLSSYQSTYGSLFVDAIERVQLHLDALWRSPPHRPHLLHGDCSPHNVMRLRSRLTPIDFQDLQFGFDVQDVAITIGDLRRHHRDETVIDAYLGGYRSIRKWPLDDDVLFEALDIGRRLNFINLGLNLQRPGWEGYIHMHAELIARWMGLATKSALV